MIINMGPQHPSTHGVLRLLLELDGETVIRCKPIVGYLHTGIEKNTEYRTWVQGVTYVTAPTTSRRSSTSSRTASRSSGSSGSRPRRAPRSCACCSAS